MMKDKPLYKSKSVIAGIVLIIYGLICLALGRPESLEEAQQIVYLIFTGVGIIGLRQAIKRSIEGGEKYY